MSNAGESVGTVDGGSSAEPTHHTGRRQRGGHARAILLRLGVVTAVVVVTGAGVWGLTRAATLQESPTTMEIPALSVEPADVEPGAAAPGNATIKGAVREEEPAQSSQPAPEQERADGDPIAAWADRAGQVLGIPPRALAAYGRAELAMRQAQPNCNLSWATLAGIGRVESNHGQFGGAVLQDNGLPSKPIIGPRLDGSGGFKAIRDTDGGHYDGDTEYDRAVGPMQFIPSTWARFAADGNGDGKADPQHIDDAALAAARYLCHGGRNMASAEGWWKGLWSYNQSVVYAQKVFGLADQYAKSLRSL